MEHGNCIMAFFKGAKSYKSEGNKYTAFITIAQQSGVELV